MERKLLAMNKNKKIICFYAISTQLGGAEKSLLELVLNLEKFSEGKYQPFLLLPKESGPLVDILDKEKIHYRTLIMPKLFLAISRETPFLSLILTVISIPSLLVYCFKLTQSLRDSDVEVLHTTGIKCHIMAVLLRPLHRKKVIWHLRDILKEGFVLNILRLLRRFGKVSVIANSGATKEAFSHKGMTNSEIEIIYNGLDSKVYFPMPQNRYRNHFEVDSKVLIVGIVGVLARWKGHLEFIQMAKLLLSQGPNARFVVIGDQIYDTVGDRDYKQLLQEEVKNRGLSSYFFFTGFEKDIPQAINGLDLVVHASIRPEPFGRVVLESMACGVPVVASAAGGVLELIEEGKTGCLHSPGNVIEMTEAVKKLIENDLLRVQLAKAAHQAFMENFTVDVCIKKIIQLYDRILLEYEKKSIIIPHS